MSGAAMAPRRAMGPLLSCVAALFLAGCASGGAGGVSADGNAATALFSRSCLAEVGNFDLAERRFAELGLTPLNGGYLDPANDLDASIANGRSGCMIVHRNRSVAGYGRAEVASFARATGSRPAPAAPLSSAGPGGLPFTPLRAGGKEYLPIMQAFGTPEEGNARLLYGLIILQR